MDVPKQFHESKVKVTKIKKRCINRHNLKSNQNGVTVIQSLSHLTQMTITQHYYGVHTIYAQAAYGVRKKSNRTVSNCNDDLKHFHRHRQMKKETSTIPAKLYTLQPRFLHQ